MNDLKFSLQDPFPLIATGADYEAEKAHAIEVDLWLGFRADEIEHQLVSDGTEFEFRDREFWIGKSIQTFSTPYTELRAMLEELQPKPSDTIIDLGAGYGRMAHVLARHFPKTKFIGYEFVRERQEEGLRVIHKMALSGAELIHADVTQLDFTQQSARFYFMYDFGSREDVEITVENLRKAALQRPITVVARGGRSREVIEKHHAWLSQVVTPVHRRHYSIYRSAD